MSENFWRVDKEVARRVPRLGLEAAVLYSELRERAKALNKDEESFYVKAEYLEKALGITKEKRRKLSGLLEEAKLIEVSRFGKDNKQFYRVIQVSCKPSSAGTPAELETQPTGELETQPTLYYINKETKLNKETEEEAVSTFQKYWNSFCKLNSIEKVSKSLKNKIIPFMTLEGLNSAETLEVLVTNINNSVFLLENRERWATASWCLSVSNKDKTKFNYVGILEGKYTGKYLQEKTGDLASSKLNRNSEKNRGLTAAILPS
jgi:hypothetical protein